MDLNQMVDLDQAVDHYMSNYEYINLASVEQGEIVMTKSYGRDRLANLEAYASVSKPVTATILMQSYEEGLITTPEDGIGGYDPECEGVLPEPYAGSEITFQQLHTHQSGIPHLSKLWRSGKLVLDFHPGTGVSYSTNGFGILGEVMSEITGSSYTRLVKEYIGKPVGGDSFTSMPWFQAPGGQVQSTMDDMARFAIGLMDGTYVSKSTLEGLVFKVYAVEAHGALCLGWYCKNGGSDQLEIYHAGSSGTPRAFLLIHPYRGYSVALTGRATSASNPQTRSNLAHDLLEILKAD